MNLEKLSAMQDKAYALHEQIRYRQEEIATCISDLSIINMRMDDDISALAEIEAEIEGLLQ